MIKLGFRVKPTTIKEVLVHPTDKINILFKELDITEKGAIFIYKGIPYALASELTFEEIGLLSDCYRLPIIYQSLSG